MHMLFTNVENGKVNLNKVMAFAGAGGGIGLPMVIGLSSAKPAHVWMLKNHTELVEAATLPPVQRVKRFADLDKKFTREIKAGEVPLLAKFLAPALTKIAEANTRGHAQMQCTITGIGCERFRLRHKQWPKDLNDLVGDGLIAKVPLDPYDGKPLRYKRTKNGVIVFSIGKEGKNKGESLDNPNVATTYYRVEFRLWSPERRRQPPRSQKKKNGGEDLPPN